MQNVARHWSTTISSAEQCLGGENAHQGISKCLLKVMYYEKLIHKLLYYCRCKNSLAILRRQSKAAKLEQCQCQDQEYIDEFQCSDIKDNMPLCDPPESKSEDPQDDTIEKETNEIDTVEKVPKTSGSVSTLSKASALAVILAVPLSIL